MVLFVCNRGEAAYILKSFRDDDFYTGYSEDLKNIIDEHKNLEDP